jgi:hypothetical protein
MYNPSYGLVFILKIDHAYYLLHYLSIENPKIINREKYQVYIYIKKRNTLQSKYDIIINAPEMYNLSHFTERKADDFFRTDIF